MGLLTIFSGAPAAVQPCGLIFPFDDLEFTASFTASQSGTGQDRGKKAEFDFNTIYDVDGSTADYGVRISGYSIEKQTGSPAPWDVDESQVRVQVPLLGIDEAVTVSSFSTSGSAVLTFEDGGFYVNDDNQWRFVAASGSLTIGASTVWTDTNIDITQSAFATFNPSACPLIGVAGYLTASCAIGAQEMVWDWGTDAVGSDFSATVDIDATAGWRFKAPGSGVWEQLPVTPYTLPAHGLTCSAITATVADATASTTYDLGVSAHASESMTVVESGPFDVDPQCPLGRYPGAAATIMVNQTDKNYERRSGGIGAQCDLLRSVKRWVPDDHAELIYRGGFPETTATASAACWNVSSNSVDLTDPTTSASASEIVHPSRSNYLGTVTGSTHAIEDPLADTNYAWITQSGDKWTIRDKSLTVISPGSCGFVPPGNTYPDRNTYLTGVYAKRNSIAGEFPGSVEDSTANPDLLGYLDHLEERVRYQNYISDPHWSFATWFPENTIDTDLDTDLDAQNIWQVGGVDTPVEYWLSIKQQYLSHTSLPLADDRRTRNFLPILPLRDSGFSTWWPGNIGGEDVAGWWWGVTRFYVKDLDPPASLTYSSASSPLWTGTDCSLSHGANITITPSTTTPVVELDLGSYSEELYQFPLIALIATLNWTGANITGVDVYLESRSGERALMCDSTGDHLFPEGPDTEYAGSWGQELGSGYVATLGTDTEVSGVSPTVLTDAEQVVNFELLPGRKGAKLRFEFTLSSTASITLDYPQLWFQPDPPRVIQEHSQHSVMIVPGGSFARFGQHVWWNGSTLAVTPEVKEPGWPYAAGFWTSSLLDALCWRRVVTEGVAANDGLDTEIATIFDAVEGQSRDRADTKNPAMLLHGGDYGRFVHVVSLRAIPPCSNLPEKARNTTTMQPTGSWEQEAWSYAVEPRRVVAPGTTPVHLATPGGTVWTAVEPTSGVTGWTVTMHRRPVDNLEGVDYQILRGPTDWAAVSPWYGYTCVIDLAETIGECISMDAHPDGRRFRAYIRGGNAIVGFCSRNGAFMDTDTGIAVDWLAIRIDKGAPTPKLYLITQEGTAIKEYASTDSGVSFGVASTLATGYKYPTIDVELDGVRLVYFLNTAGTAVYGIGRDKEGNTLWGPSSVLGGIDDSPIAVRKQVMANGLATIFLAVVIAGAIVEYSSTDGLTFT